MGEATFVRDAEVEAIVSIEQTFLPVTMQARGSRIDRRAILHQSSKWFMEIGSITSIVGTRNLKRREPTAPIRYTFSFDGGGIFSLHLAGACIHYVLMWAGSSSRSLSSSWLRWVDFAGSRGAGD